MTRLQTSFKWKIYHILYDNYTKSTIFLDRRHFIFYIAILLGNTSLLSYNTVSIEDSEYESDKTPYKLPTSQNGII